MDGSAWCKILAVQQAKVCLNQLIVYKLLSFSGEVSAKM